MKPPTFPLKVRVCWCQEWGGGGGKARGEPCSPGVGALPAALLG